MVTVVSADLLETVLLLEALAPRVLPAGLLPEELQAARAALKDMAHRIPATDRVFGFIYWSLYSVDFD